MDKVTVKWITDWADCDTCGSNYAEGAEVTINGKAITDFIPSAHCYNGKNFTPSQVIKGILEHFNIEVEIENE